MRLISKLLCSSILVCSSLAASASSFSSLVIFGDSLSDSGNNSVFPTYRRKSQPGHHG